MNVLALATGARPRGGRCRARKCGRPGRRGPAAAGSGGDDNSKPAGWEHSPLAAGGRYCRSAGVPRPSPTGAVPLARRYPPAAVERGRRSAPHTARRSLRGHRRAAAEHARLQHGALGAGGTRRVAVEALRRRPTAQDCRHRPALAAVVTYPQMRTKGSGYRRQLLLPRPRWRLGISRAQPVPDRRGRGRRDLAAPSCRR